MKALIIGGTGHIGRYLVRMLHAADIETLVVSSGRKELPDEEAFKRVTYYKLDYSTSVKDGSMHELLARTRPDTVVDFLQSATDLLFDQCINAGVSHLIACGSVWMFGAPTVVPTPEAIQGECALTGAVSRLAAIYRAIERSAEDGLAFTAVMPPNVCGPGKIPLEGKGGRSAEVHIEHRQGVPVVLPGDGGNLIAPCDASDVAKGFFLALTKREAAAGEIFNVGPLHALTFKKFVETYAEIYGTKIPIEYVAVDEFREKVLPNIGANMHFLQHMCPDISKISARLGYKPSFSSQEAMARAVRWMIDNHVI